MRNSSRPILNLPRTPLETLLEVLTVFSIIVVFVITVWGYFTLPAIIPTHYNFQGVPDSYGGKASLFIMPVLALCQAVLLTFVCLYPHRYNYPWPITAENAPRQYLLARLLMHALALEIAVMFCVEQWFLIQAAQSYYAGIILLVALAFVLLIIITIILYMRTAARAR